MDWLNVKALKPHLPIIVLSICLVGAALAIIILCTLLHREMSVDVFGRQLNLSKNSVSRGPPGDGFKRTANGHFNIDGRKLRNVGDPEEDRDGASLGAVRAVVDNRDLLLRQSIALLRQDCEHSKRSTKNELDKIRFDIEKIQESVSSVQKLASEQSGAIKQIAEKLNGPDV